MQSTSFVWLLYSFSVYFVCSKNFDYHWWNAPALDRYPKVPDVSVYWPVNWDVMMNHLRTRSRFGKKRKKQTNTRPRDDSEKERIERAKEKSSLQRGKGASFWPTIWSFLNDLSNFTIFTLKIIKKISEEVYFDIEKETNVLPEKSKFKKEDLILFHQW